MSEMAWSTGLPRPRRPARAALVAIALAAGAAGLALWWPDSHEAGVGVPRDPAALPQDALIGTSGVRVVRVAVTGGGGLVDLRYQVLDAEKAASIHDTRPPAVVDERAGTVLDRPWMGHDPSQHATKPGRTAYVLLQNPNESVQAGSSVTVRLGDGELRHVLVR